MPEPLAPDEPLVAPPAVDPAPPVVPAEGSVTAPDIGEQAPPSQPEDKPEEVITPEQAAKREGRRFGRRLDAANRRAAEHQARADFLDRQLNELKALSSKPPVDSGAPKVENFTDIGEFEAASAKYHREQGIKEYEANQRTQSNQQAQARLSSEWGKAAERGSEKYDDFDDVVGDMKPTTPMHAAIMGCENAEDVAHFLGKNRDEAMRIISLDPVGQIRAIGRLEAKLLAEPAKPKTPSQAPAPITPVGGKSGGASDQPLDTDDINTWMKKENARMSKTGA